MGDLIQFPAKRIIRRNPTTQQIESDAKRKKAKELYFIEQLTEEIVLHAIHVLQDNAIKMKDDKFLRDLAVIIEAIKSLIHRDFGRRHKMQAIADTLATIKKLPDGKQVTDLDYSKIFVSKKKNDVDPLRDG
tara:strand:+ start:620 stop:1015 length:396 start_codon:yes stop_codon:yes gene_type:complete